MENAYHRKMISPPENPYNKKPSPKSSPLPMSKSSEKPSPAISPPVQSSYSDINQLPVKQESPFENCVITPTSIQSQEIVPSSSFSCTQEAITSVQRDIVSLRHSFPPKPSTTKSSNQHLVVSMGNEVRELKKEVMFLVESLQQSMRHKELLQCRLAYFEEREEDELISQSRENERDKEYFSRRYSRKRNFSDNFNPN